MKKFILLIAACLSAGISEAYACERLLIRSKDGSETNVLAQNMRINISGENLVLSHSDGTTTLSIPGLSSMEFLNDEAHIEDILSSHNSDIVVYTLQGRYAGRFHSIEDGIDYIAEAGVYVIVAQSGTVKLFIDK